MSKRADAPLPLWETARVGQDEVPDFGERLIESFREDGEATLIVHDSLPEGLRPEAWPDEKEKGRGAYSIDSWLTRGR